MDTINGRRANSSDGCRITLLAVGREITCISTDLGMWPYNFLTEPLLIYHRPGPIPPGS